MSKTSETGHAKNLATFDELVSFVAAYGTAYNPSKTSLSFASLQALSAEARTALVNLNASVPAYTNAIAAREVAFEPLSKLITRVINALKATDTSQQVDENARTLVRKIQGTRATPKMTEEEKAALQAEGNETKEISTSQMSFDNRLENFHRLIKLLSSIPEYVPNEEDLSVNGLTDLYNDLMSKNAAVVNASTGLSNARIVRNNLLYKLNTGLVDTSIAVKAYVKSLFGASSPQYKQVSGLVFKSVKF
jgi:hypothetical protein